MEKAQDRLEVLKKIEEFEKNGMFDVDPEIDPPSKELKPKQIDYLRKKPLSKIKTALANKIGRKFIQSLIDNGSLRLKEIKGLENLDNLTTGAVLTLNHFNIMDSFVIQLAYEKTHYYKKKKLFKVIKEGNYTSMTGLFGRLLRNCNTLPLSSNKKTMMNFMRATDKLLKKGNLVLIYPEQAMWWNYKKPRPFKNGAFRIASKSNVPVVPCFITMTETDNLEPNGFYTLEYTLHIEKPIYPSEQLTEKENANKIMEQNYNIWKNIYETTYGEKLVYNLNNDKI